MKLFVANLMAVSAFTYKMNSVWHHPLHPGRARPRFGPGWTAIFRPGPGHPGRAKVLGRGPPKVVEFIVLTVKLTFFCMKFTQIHIFLSVKNTLSIEFDRFYSQKVLFFLPRAGPGRDSGNGIWAGLGLRVTRAGPRSDIARAGWAGNSGLDSNTKGNSFRLRRSKFLGQICIYRLFWRFLSILEVFWFFFDFLNFFFLISKIDNFLQLALLESRGVWKLLKIFRWTTLSLTPFR